MSSITEQVGRVVGGRYRLLAPIGTGASSQVFAALDTRLGRRVAVKVLHPALASDGAFLRRFRAEARLAASLDHPHVMRVFDWGEEDAGPYLVLELLTGGSLRALLDTGVHLSHSQVTAFGLEAASGLAYAHRRGIIHRDIKPGNLLFDDEGHLRIADFGVARAIAEAALTEPIGTIFGTARYSSPEQANGSVLDDRTDVYSLVLVMYEALTGRVPFSADTVSATLMARVDATLPASSALGPLSPILAAAAISQPFARLDAASLAGELGVLQRQLPRADPLPLAHIELGRDASRWADRDPTDIDAAAVGRHRTTQFDQIPLDSPPDGAATEELIEDMTAMTLSPLIPLSTGSTGSGESAESAERASSDSTSDSTATASTNRRRNRILAGVLSGIVVACLIAAGVTVAVVHYGVYGHVVPKLVGDDVATARAMAENNGLRLTVGSTTYDISAPKGQVIHQSIVPGRRERAGTIVIVTESKGPPPVPVPALTPGETQKTARSALAAGHLVAKVKLEYSETVGAGKVISENPPSSAGDQPWKSTVVLYVSKGPHPRIVPSVYDVPLATAIADLHNVQLNYALGTKQYSTTVPDGYVISESPLAKASVRRDSTVTLVVSLGKPYVTIPPIQGLPVQKATSELQALGLHVQVYGPGGGGDVYASDPDQGASIREGSTVLLFTF